MTRAMSILHQWDAAGRDIRSNGLAEGHNGAELFRKSLFSTMSSGALIEIAASRRQAGVPMLQTPFLGVLGLSYLRQSPSD